MDPAHRRSLAIHATRRLFERHGLAISHGEYWMYCKVIDDGLAPVLGNAFKGGTIHCITVCERPVYAIWNPEQRAIATFLLGVPLELRRQTEAA